jgi:hypothetical protein
VYLLLVSRFFPLFAGINLLLFPPLLASAIRAPTVWKTLPSLQSAFDALGEPPADLLPARDDCSYACLGRSLGAIE